MTALAIGSPYALAPRLKDPAQSLWSELRFARRPLDLFTILVGAIRHCEDAHATRGDTYRAMERQISAWCDAGIVIAAGMPAAYSLERKYLRMASPPSLPTPPLRSPFPKRTQRQRLWSAMKVLRNFDLPTLLMAAAATRPAALDMIRVLVRGGWLRSTANGWSTGATRKWGPVAPTIARVADASGPVVRVVDPVTGQTLNLPVRPKALRDRHRESSENRLVDGGVS